MRPPTRRPPRRRPRHRALVAVLLVVYSAALAVALLAPSSQDQSQMAGWLRDLGVDVGIAPYRATQARAEFLANALILAPVAALGSLLWTRTTWRDWTAYTFVIACAVEMAQGLFLPGRTPSTVDVVANTLGGLLGSVVVAVGWLVVGALPRTDPGAGTGAGSNTAGAGRAGFDAGR